MKNDKFKEWREFKIIENSTFIKTFHTFDIQILIFEISHI